MNQLCFGIEEASPGAWESHDKFPTAMIALAHIDLGKKTDEKGVNAILDVVGGFALALDKLDEIEGTKRHEKDIRTALRFCERIEREVKSQDLQRVPFKPRLV